MCYKDVSQANLFFSPGQIISYRDSMAAYIRANKKEPLDESRINSYCDCAVAIMAKLKVKIGPVVNVWMLDCGATDMLVSDTMINKLLQLKLVSRNDFLGQQTYTLANGKEILCDEYRINQVQVGR